MTNADDEMPSSDRILMLALADAIGGSRPPIDLVAHCEGLLAWIDVESELAELLDQPVAEAAGTRGAATSAPSLEFSVMDGTCVIEITPSADVLRGQVLGGDAELVVVRTTAGATKSSTVDSLGAFEISNPPAGTIRLEFDLAEGRRICTDWFVV
ncbi:MAG: hypothetical protein ABI862_21405 [Ilumatobacteraceae bacterium]